MSEDLARKGYVGRTVGIKLRFADFRTVRRDVTLPEATSDATAIPRAAAECLRRVVLDRRLRLLGVRVSALDKLGTVRGELQHSLPLDDLPIVTVTGTSTD
ncbi:hypothetical protein PBS_02480 [Paraburkholderia sp. 2C]